MSLRNFLKSGNLFSFRSRHVFLATLAFSSVAPQVRAVEQDLLWLPRNYNHHYKTLYRAATTVEQHERCTKVIAASLSESESNIEHPVFKITCRDQERISFVAKVDGFTNEILNLPPSRAEAQEIEAGLSPEELARQVHEAKLSEYWQLCFAQVERRARKLNSLEWVYEGQPTPVEESETRLLYHVDFNARTNTGEALAYRAQCEFAGDVENIEIHARDLPGAAMDDDEKSAEDTIEEQKQEEGIKK